MTLLLRLLNKQSALIRNLTASKYVTQFLSSSNNKNPPQFRFNQASPNFNSTRSFSLFKNSLLSDKKSSKKYFKIEKSFLLKIYLFIF